MSLEYLEAFQELENETRGVKGAGSEGRENE